MPARARARQRRVREDDGRVGVRPDSILAVASGVEGLAGTLLHQAVQTGDREWLQSEAAAFWAGVAGLPRREYERTLRAWLG